MERQRSAALLRFYEQNERALGAINGCLSQAVPDSYTMLRPLRAPHEVAGTTLGTLVREHSIVSISRHPRRHFGDLAFSVGPNQSLVFSDGYGERVRVRKLPIDWRRRRPVRLPSVRQLALLSERQLSLLRQLPKIEGEELVVLWKPDPDSAALARAVLASVIKIKDSSKTRVLDFADLPEFTTTWQGPRGIPAQPIPEDDFDDFFGDASGILGPDSA